MKAVLPSSLPLTHQRIIANELYLEIKENRWRRAKATRTTTPGKPPPHRTLGAHTSTDTDLVRQRDTDILWDERYIRILIPPERRFDFPPTAVQLYKASYDIAIRDLQGDGMLDSWHQLLASPIRTPFRPDRNRHGHLTMRRNILTPGVTEQAATAAITLLAYTTIQILTPDQIDELANTHPHLDLATLITATR